MNCLINIRSSSTEYLDGWPPEEKSFMEEKKEGWKVKRISMNDLNHNIFFFNWITQSSFSSVEPYTEDFLSRKYSKVVFEVFFSIEDCDGDPFLIEINNGFFISLKGLNSSFFFLQGLLWVVFYWPQKRFCKKISSLLTLFLNRGRP